MLDVTLDDPFQEYLARAEQFSVIHGLYFAPEEAITKKEFIDMLVLLKKIPRNTSLLPIFPDVDENTEYFQSIQDYGYTLSVK